MRKVNTFYEADQLFQECKHLYRFKVGMANCIITHLAKVSEIAPLEWNFKSSLGWKEAVKGRMKRKTDTDGKV